MTFRSEGSGKGEISARTVASDAYVCSVYSEFFGMLNGIRYSCRAVRKSLRERMFGSQPVVDCQHLHLSGGRHAVAETSATVQTADGPSASMQINE